VTALGVISVNVPTVGGTLAGWYHQYQITRPGYEAKNGLWVKLDIPAKFRVNAIHSTLLYNGDVLIMAGSGNNQSFFNAGTFKTLLLNPVTMHEQLIPTPWDLFCAGHIELPDGNILVAGGTARYENLDPVYPGGAMTVVNADPTRSRTLPRGTIFIAPNGTKFASAAAVTVPRGGQQNVWVDAIRKGKGSLQLLPGSDTNDSLAMSLTMNTMGAPHWLAAIGHGLSALIPYGGVSVVVDLVVLQAFAGVGALLAGRTGRIAVWTGIALSLLFWPARTWASTGRDWPPIRAPPRC
jgi:hypothetical protein